MKRFGLVILLLTFGLVCLSAATVTSVRASDSGNTSSRITIRLDETGSYKYTSSGDKITITIPNATLGTTEADYRRLSHVVDYINVSQDASNTYVNIKTMGEFNSTHFKQGNSIVIDVVNPQGKPVTQEHPVVTAAQAATPRPVKPAITPAPATPGTELKPEAPAATQVVKPDSIAPKAKKPTVKYDKIPFWDNMAMAIEPSLELYGFLLFAMLSILIFLIFSKVGSNPAPKAKKRTADLGLNGATLIMDSETKIKMVTKLLNEGWTSREIAKEMKLPHKDVEMLVSRAQFSDHS